ncbi:M60 family metallopeptidase [Spiroplasma endosymbiont of Labia minor]|uniref:M60 family metallopeptidase n=1 Tax=Spiroplasma endosymbiont of Labia minor TaxID=3066305 RepID=UPI0030CC527C
MKKILSFIILVNLSTASFTNLISCATIEIDNGSDGKYNREFNNAVKENKKDFTLDELKSINQTVLKHSPFATTKYFIKQNDSITIKFKMDGIETYDELITKYPDMKLFSISIFYGGIFASYGLTKSNSKQELPLKKDNGFQYNKEYTFTANISGFLFFTDFPWFQKEDISKIRNGITVKSNKLMENLYYNFNENSYSNSEIWNELYKLESRYKFTRNSVLDETIIPDNPFMILEGKKFIYIIEVKRLLTYLTFRMEKDIDYHNFSINALVNYLDAAREASDENYGLNENYYGNDYAPNYKLMAFDNDAGAGQYYATDMYISMHDVCFEEVNGKYVGKSNWGLNVKTVYDSLILNPSLNLTNAKNDNEALKKMKAEINWGLWHEIGHTYQNTNYKLSWWTEVTVNINSFMISRKFYEENADPSNYDSTTGWLVKWYDNSNEYITKIKALATNGITFANLNLYNEYVTTDYGALFWFQLISAFGDQFIPTLNHYYRVNKDELTNLKNDTEKLDTLIEVISKITRTNITKFSKWWNIELSDETKTMMNALGEDTSDKITDNLLKNKWYQPYEDKIAVDNLGNYYDKLYHLPGDDNTQISIDETIILEDFGSYIIKKLTNKNMNFSGTIFVSKKNSD